MTDLKALRREMADNIAGAYLDAFDESHAPLKNDIESALLRYAKAVLGEPSEGMVDAGAFAHTPRATWGTMAAQRMKEIE